METLHHAKNYQRDSYLKKKSQELTIHIFVVRRASNHQSDSNLFITVKRTIPYSTLDAGHNRKHGERQANKDVKVEFY